MNYFIAFILLFMSCSSFKVRTAKAQEDRPVIGFKQILFKNPYYKSKRKLLIWYPVRPNEKGEISHNPWDTFLIAKDAQILKAKEKYPVIVLSHGYSGSGHDFAWLTVELIKNGFMVIAITHQDRINGIDYWRRARDISTILNKFAKSSLAPYSSNKVGIAGFSLGGTTAIFTIGGRALKLDHINPGKEFSSDIYVTPDLIKNLDKEMMKKDWRDTRIKAAFLMAPAWAWIFDENSLKKISTPTYIVASESDKVLVSKNNAGFFAKNIPNSKYNFIKGKAGHFIFVTLLDKNARDIIDPQGNVDFLFKDDISVNRKLLQEQIANEAVNFFKANLQK